MKKSLKALGFVFLTLLLACAAAMCVGCEGKTELKTPTGLELTAADVLEWDAVEGAASYNVSIDGEEYYTKTNSLDVFEILNRYKTYEIKVAANGESEKVVDSDWSEELTVTIELPVWLGLLPTEDGNGYEITVKEADKAKVEGKVIIPALVAGKAVLGIKVSAFERCAEVTGVILPDTVEYIDDFAFRNCSKLMRVRWSAGLREIGGNAFYGTAIETLVLPEGLTKLSNSFQNCENLKSVRLPASLKKMCMPNGSSDVNPFAYCRNLEKLSVADGNEIYESDGNCIMRKGDNTLVTGCKEGTIPAYAEHIGAHAFTGMGLEKISLPEGVTSLENSAFYDNDCLTSVILPQSLTSKGERAFGRCGRLESIDLPDGLKVIGYGAFAWCTSLKSIKIPDSTESVGDNAFETCVELKEISFGKELKSVGEGVTAFCINLEKITIAENNLYFDGAGSCLVRKADNTVVAGCKTSEIPLGAEHIGAYAFYGQTGLTDIELPSALLSIEKGAFSCSRLNRLKLPDGLQRIERYAFENCVDLLHVAIPDSVIFIGAKAFFCADMGLVLGPMNLIPLIMTVIVPDSVEEIEALAFFGSYTVYTSRTERPEGWVCRSSWDGRSEAWNGNGVVFWGCELAFGGDKLPYLVSVPTDSYPLAGPSYMPERDGYEFKGWAAEQGGGAVVAAKKIEKTFNPLLPDRLDLKLNNVFYDPKSYLYFYVKTYEMLVVENEEVARLAERGVTRLYAVWEKQA